MPGPPDLPAVAAAFHRHSALNVVIGGFAVIAHEHIRATEDVDLLIPQDDANHSRVARALADLGAHFAGDRAELDVEMITEMPHLRLDCGEHGMVDLLKEGEPPLDFASVADGAITASIRGTPIRFAGLASIVAFKRLAGRPRDRQDLEALTEIHGELPMLRVPGLDT